MKLKDIGLMLAKPGRPFTHASWVHELKFDGWRALANREQLLSRKKTDLTKRFAPIAKALQALPGDFVLDGELCLVDENGIPDFEALQSMRRDRALAYFVFDMLFENGEDLRGLPLLERKERLRAFLPKDHLSIRFVDFLPAQGEVLYDYAVSIGMEGIVSKRADSKYVAGLNDYWRKSKPTGYHDGFKRPLRRKASSTKPPPSKKEAASRRGGRNDIKR